MLPGHGRLRLGRPIRDDVHFDGEQLAQEAGELHVREVVPAATGVVLDGLRVARQGDVLGELPRELPGVGQVFLLPAREPAPRDDLPIPLAELALPEPAEAAAEDSVLARDEADRVLGIGELEQVAPEDVDGLATRQRSPAGRKSDGFSHVGSARARL